VGVDAKAKLISDFGIELAANLVMTAQPTTNLPLANLNSESIRKFVESIAGEVILPDDARYPKARRVWNHAFDKKPAMIARCAGVDDVRRAIEFARHNELLTAVRSGGHSFAGYGVCDGGLVIDLSLMKTAAIDPGRQLITIGGGVAAAELDCLAQAFKMAVPLGSCMTVGVSGYALGGGESSITPKFGYGCDSIRGVDVVTADGRIVTARDGENDDLFWAMRGAGANFGVATSLEFRLHPIEKVFSGHLRYPIRQARKVLRFLDEYTRSIPDDLFIIAAVLPHPGERMLDVAVVWPDEEKKGERAIRPLRKFLNPFEDTVQTRDYLDEQRAGSDSPAHGDYSSHRRGGHFERLTEETIEVIAEYASNSPSESSGITMMYWHGPWCSIPRDDAFGFRVTGYEYWVHSYWQKSGMRKKSYQWVEDFFAAMRPLSTGKVYVNDLEDEGEERVQAAYGDKYERLAQLKRKYDPENFFRSNQNIRRG
jgi:FAD/FMN-containing dehydrogenase